MATRRKATKGDAPNWELSHQQQTAVDLIIAGQNYQKVADSIGVARATVSQWANHDPGFQAALNCRRQELWGELRHALRALLPRAVDVVEAELAGPSPVPVALALLKMCNLAAGLGASPGPTDPETIAAAQRLHEDELRHAAEEAALEVERRSSDRFFSAVAHARGRMPHGSP